MFGGLRCRRPCTAAGNNSASERAERRIAGGPGVRETSRRQSWSKRCSLFVIKKESSLLYVGEIASGVNAVLERGRGEMLELTPRQVGSKLRSMGITTKRLDGLGRGIQLLDPVRRRIHRLAWNYQIGFGLLEWDDPRTNCPHCRQVPRTEEGPEPLARLERERTARHHRMMCLCSWCLSAYRVRRAHQCS